MAGTQTTLKQLASANLYHSVTKTCKAVLGCAALFLSAGSHRWPQFLNC